MPSQGPFIVGTGAVDASFGNFAWAVPENITTEDGNFSSFGTASTNTMRYLKGTNAGFSVPSNATITGIKAEFKRSRSGTVTDLRVRIVKNGVIGTTDLSLGALWPTTLTWDSFGGDGQLWGEIWTPADINASTFGVVISATINAFATIQVDAVRLTVYYTLPSSEGTTEEEIVVTIDPRIAFLEELFGRRGRREGGFNPAWFLELTGGELVIPTAFEPDASTFRGNYYYHAVTNVLYRKVITRQQPGIIVAHWVRVSL